MTPVLRRRHLLIGVALASAGILVGYAALATMHDTTQDRRPLAAAPTLDIESLMPVSPHDLASATELARRFVSAYGSYRYDQNPDTYLAPLRPMTGDALFQQLTRSATDSAVRAAQTNDQTIATADAEVTGIRDLRQTTVIFTVTGHQHIQHADHTEQDNQDFTVTVGRASTNDSWRVLNLAPATSGQDGNQQ
jgi:hypothetical protein